MIQRDVRSWDAVPGRVTNSSNNGRTRLTTVRDDQIRSCDIMHQTPRS